MGKHFDPGNAGFKEALNSYYVDKTGLIELINRSINTKIKLTCISRPRRFGKSFAAQMLCAYYDCTCDSHELFDQYEISKADTYEEHMNQYHVISLDITGFLSEVKSEKGDISDVPKMIADALQNELVQEYSDLAGISGLTNSLLEYVKKTGRKIIFVIDEWDALIREAKHDEVTQEAFLNFLRSLFKNNDFTPHAVAAAYMTGILPIKKDGSQSAISDFQEYSILDPNGFADYTGFTEEEVKCICNDYSMGFAKAKQWYDGYNAGEVGSIYNPYSVMMAMTRKKYGSYWKKTSAAEALTTYINMNYEGLQEDIVRLIAGETLEINTDDFENDFETFISKDDVLTLMIHLGYLAYDEETGSIRIPNEEVRGEFTSLIRKADTNKLAELIRTSNQLLSDTLAGDNDAVAKAIGKICMTEYAPNFYNNEQALRYVIKFAYIVCVDKYKKVEKLPSGKGIADVVFLPKRNTPDPAMVVELKWNKTSEAAISQIKEKNWSSRNDTNSFWCSVLSRSSAADIKRSRKQSVP